MMKECRDVQIFLDWYDVIPFTDVRMDEKSRRVEEPEAVLERLVRKLNIGKEVMMLKVGG